MKFPHQASAVVKGIVLHLEMNSSIMRTKGIRAPSPISLPLAIPKCGLQSSDPQRAGFLRVAFPEASSSQLFIPMAACK